LVYWIKIIINNIYYFLMKQFLVLN
jgi:hypothetical protein